MPDKRVIILDISPSTDGQSIPVNWVLWADVPTPLMPFYANAAATSAYSGATADELAALQSGAVTELRGVTVFPPDATKADMAADGELVWQAFQDRVNNDPRFVYFGTFWDGTSWIGPDGSVIVADGSGLLSGETLPKLPPPPEPEVTHVPFAYEQAVEAEHG
jgi:hypothetical protein